MRMNYPHKAILRVTPDLLRRALRLPDSTTIEYAVGGTDAAGNVELVASDDAFPETAEGNRLPDASPSFGPEGVISWAK